MLFHRLHRIRFHRQRRIDSTAIFFRTPNSRQIFFALLLCFVPRGLQAQTNLETAAASVESAIEDTVVQRLIARVHELESKLQRILEERNLSAFMPFHADRGHGFYKSWRFAKRRDVESNHVAIATEPTGESLAVIVESVSKHADDGSAVEGTTQARKQETRRHERRIDWSALNLIGTLLSWGIFVIIGTALWYLIPGLTRTSAEIVEQEGVRAALVGLALGFLSLPAYVLGTILLTMSIIGIIFVPFWLVLIPLLATLLVVIGYSVSAYVVGKRLGAAYPDVSWLQSPAGHLAIGFAVPFAILLLAHLMAMSGSLFSWSFGLLRIFSGAISTIFTVLGVGAVMIALSRKRKQHISG